LEKGIHPKQKGVNMTDITQLSRDEFQKAIISKNDTNDYDCSGYIIAQHGEQFAIARFGHCSCYGTYTSLTDHKRNNGVNWDWIGTRQELLKMARYKLDPHFSLGSRKAQPNDYDYCYLIACYKDILAWNKKQQK
jgi:hypothetical protein